MLALDQPSGPCHARILYDELFTGELPHAIHDFHGKRAYPSKGSLVVERRGQKLPGQGSDDDENIRYQYRERRVTIVLTLKDLTSWVGAQGNH